MKIINYKIENPILLGSAGITTCVIENPDFFVYAVKELDEQVKGREGDFLLYKNNKELKFGDTVAMVIDPINLNFNERKIVNKLFTKLKGVAHDSENYIHTKETMALLESYLYKILEQIDYAITFDDEIDLLGLFKCCGIRLQTEYNNLLEKFIDYINILLELGIAKTLVLINIKSYIKYSDLQELYKHCIYNDFNLLLIESESQKIIDKVERVLIIDNDLCEILVNSP